MQGILQEADEIAEEFKGSDALDASIIASAQAIEHYEITRYGTLKIWALELGMQDVARLLDRNLEEEKKTDQLLTKMAEERINERAA